ncbi:hypothetical protein [Bradyrhizobium betae]|uniref:PQQ-binding-like beta-propeller repeat protein n=1 Tax=Bradyrhizobium betae TaxID=244734 RepID=A0A4Q1V4N0_9BRAD|nr:hypothetical protein [Bradyrhizobium betae]RXT44837.1 hypothetical protein B5V03_19825 [Bradyrhizobium betae]
MLDPYAIHSAAAADGSIWIGGTTNKGRSYASAPLSDAYLAKVGPDGHLVWEVVIARKRENSIFDMAILPSGDAVIIGREDDANWLARISGDGEILWEKTFGLGEIASVAVLNDLIAVMAFEAVEGEAKGAGARVALWRFETEGQLLDHHVVRDDGAGRALPG